MTKQTESQKCLGGSPAGISFSRLCTLTLAAILATGGAAAGFAQAQPDAAKPAKPAEEKKAAAEPTEKIAHGYLIHQSIELGGRRVTTTGSTAMWDTLVNQSSGARILGQSLELHSVNPSKTPFFDSLSTNSIGYGGDPYDVSYLKISKGRLYDFAGSFRRDRNFFDYNLLANSLISNGVTAAPALVAEPDSLHAFNTVRRNTDALLTLMPLSIVSFRAGINHGTHEGPAYSTIHYGPDVQVAEWFRNSQNTYTGGVDVKLAKRTTLSYDQFYVFYKGDSSYKLAGTPGTTPIAPLPATPALFQLSSGAPVSLGVDTLATATCGSGANKTLEVVNGVVNPFCSGATAESGKMPMRSTFPTEQLRFSSHYWDKLSFNGRLLYSGGTGTVNNFNQTFVGFSSRTHVLQQILTGAGSNGQMANNKRVSTNGDFGVVAEFSKYFSVSEAFNYWNFRNEGNMTMNLENWTATAATTSMLTPLTDPTVTHTAPTALDPDPANLNQRIEQNTILATATITPQFKMTGGWRFKSRHIGDANADGTNDLSWHENGAILGAVLQPSRVFRLNINFDSMKSSYVSSVNDAGRLPTNTFVRDAPDISYHVRARATVKPAKWVNFAIALNDFSGKNDDPLVNHKEHSHDFSFATSFIPTEGLSLDFNYAHDDVFSQTDICYFSSAPLSGASNSGTCTAANSPGSGDPSFLLGTGYYDAPSTFFAGAVNFAPSKYFRFNGGMRINSTNGTAEQLNPLMVPGALHSKYLTPYADLEIHIASQWAWHGNWTHDGYTEGGPIGLLPSRNTHGDMMTLGVKYAF